MRPLPAVFHAPVVLQRSMNNLAVLAALHIRGRATPPGVRRQMARAKLGRVAS